MNAPPPPIAIDGWIQWSARSHEFFDEKSGVAIAAPQGPDAFAILLDVLLPLNGIGSERGAPFRLEVRAPS